MNKKILRSIIIATLLLNVLAGKATSITIMSYNHSNILVETKNFTSSVTDKVVIESMERVITDVKIFEVKGEKKDLLFEGDLSFNKDQPAEAVAFPYNLLLIKEIGTDTTAPLNLKPVDIKDINTITTLLKSKHNESKRLEVYKDILKQYSFTSAQLAVILSGFTFEEIKAHAAVMSYANVSDKKNFLRLYYLLMNVPDSTPDKLAD